jgi:formate hydrogenlyase subunit 3/multisubunit Na+/H+ antiporter MnhD subunit
VSGLLLLLVGVPLAAAAITYYLGARRSSLALRVSILAAVALVVLTMSRTMVDVRLDLLAERGLLLSPVAQLGVQLLALAMLGLVLSLEDEEPELVAGWLPVAWLSVAGLTVALMITSLPLAVIAFFGAAMLWAFGLPDSSRRRSSGPVMRYVALLALAMPLLMIAFLFAEERTTATPQIEWITLALAVPAFGLLLGVIPLHAWTLTLASGTPRAMLFGVIGLVQTAGFALLLRALTTSAYPWLVEPSRGLLIGGGAISMLVGGWLALSARMDDPDDFLVLAFVANTGLLLAGLGAHSAAAGAGVALLLFARVLALVLLAMAPRVAGTRRRIAYAFGILTLAGTPGLAGFPGLWLIVTHLGSGRTSLAQVALLAGSAMLFATAVRRWRADVPGDESHVDTGPGAGRIVLVLAVLLVVLGLAPQIIAPAFTGAMRGMYFVYP